ncbi:hypothetical protein DQ239_02325 [Blastococcus sp. TF02-09]|uniref:hypothetical protein n=1 Tax=Blastococcus sp. TF02-09 TaxID=2250576 RepID=UPI000DEAA08F|nr:hypothetical protein [Blastococcus sp. TF02-9]RBY81442.1 hypothetical protein DQ239_02325 [Blastococcus sp. TF02-9]
MTTEELLRTELRAWADEVAPDGSRDLSAAGLTDLRRRRLRHRAELLAAAVAVVAVLLGAQAGASRLLDGSDRSTAAPTPTPAVDVLGLPARGPLAGDAAVLEALVQLPWASDGAPAGRDPVVSGIPDPRVETRRVLWAGDSPAGLRLAVVAGENNAQPVDRDPERQSDLGALGSTAVAVFVGPAGAPVDQLRLTGVPHGRTDGRPIALRDATTGTALVLAAPGDYVEIAERPEYDADGVESFDFRPVDAPDGAALITAEHGYAMQYRVWRDGGTVVDGQPFDTVLSDPAAPGDEAAIAAALDVRFLRSPAAEAPLDASSLVVQSGLPPEQVDVVVPWTGSVPSRDGLPMTATLTTATLPSSAVLVSLTVSRSFADGSRGSSDCGDGWYTKVLPGGGINIAERTFVFRCTTHDMSGLGGSELTSLVVVAPVGAATARLLDGTGAVLAEVPLDDGVLVTTDEELVADTTSVVPLGADGREHTRAGLLTGD